MTKRDRDLWINDCRWEVRIANDRLDAALKRLSEAAREVDAAVSDERFAREQRDAALKQLATAEKGRRRPRA